MTISDIGSVATAIAVLIAAWELRFNNRIARADYEDSLDRQYRDLAMVIPMDLFLGKEVEITVEQREAIFNYFDLSNEQIYQNIKGRITKDTWKDWRAGILANMNKPGFRAVYKEVQDSSKDTFTYLNQLLEQNYEQR